MIKILRKYNKKILAVLGVFLMISFIADLGFRRYGRLQGEGQSPGAIGKQAITTAEYQYAWQAWQMLRGGMAGLAQPIGLGPDGQPEYLTLMDSQLAIKLAGSLPPQYALGTARAILRKLTPTDFLLLLKEAQRMGIVVSEDRVQAILQQVSEFPTDEPAFRERVVRDWLTVFEAFDHIADSVKISQALGVHQVAREEQQVSLKYVPFRADDFTKGVPAPTTQQITDFFNKYKNADPESNDPGIGYRYPNRVKIEYIGIPFENIKKAISDEDTYEYCARHWPELPFPTTQPSTQASTQPATQPVAEGPATKQATMPAVAAAPTSLPTTRPWKDLSTADRIRAWDQVKDSIRDNMARELTVAVTKNAMQIINGDWAMYRQGIVTGQKSEETAVGVPFDGPSYMIRLAKKIQASKEARNVLPETASTGDWQSKKDLAEMPGIGKSRLGISGSRQTVSFADYAFERAAAFMSDADKKVAQENQVQLLATFQPSLPLDDVKGNYYIFRITAGDPAHAAATVAEVEGKVKSDWTATQAYDLAKQAAGKFLESAKSQGLDAAAKAAGDLPVTTTGLFYNNARAEIPKFTLGEQAKPKLIEDAFGLLRQRLQSGNLHPMQQVDLPRARIAVVAQLENATPAIEHPGFAQRVFATQNNAEGELLIGLAANWFNPEQIQHRMDFKPSEASTRRRGPERPEPIPPPIF